VSFGAVGGDVLSRSLEPHLRAFSGFGFDVATRGGQVEILGCAPRAAEFSLDDREAGITASALALILAAAAEGQSVIRGVNREPEVIEVSRYLSACGAQVGWDGARAVVRGPCSTKPAEWLIPPDRIVWGTFAAVVAATGGHVEMSSLPEEWLPNVLPPFVDAGIDVSVGRGSIVVSGRPTRPLTIETGAFARFPSDLGPPMIVLMATAPGRSRLRERVYPDRFDHVRQLAGSGLSAVIEGDTLTVDGGCRLRGGVWTGSGVRESAALLLSGLVAEGQSTIVNASAISRGYEDLSGGLRALGADIDAIRDFEEE
jgi:UDP-N-acetylglucosamine 1-carboxyvinyltransferase